MSVPNRPLYRLFNLDSNPLLLIARYHNSLTSRIVCPTTTATIVIILVQRIHALSEFVRRMKMASGLENDRWKTDGDVILLVCLFIWLCVCAREQNLFNYNVQYVLIGVKCILKLLNAYANGRFNTADNGEIRWWMWEEAKLLEVYLNAKIIRLVCMRVQTGSQFSIGGDVVRAHKSADIHTKTRRRNDHH